MVTMENHIREQFIRRLRQLWSEIYFDVVGSEGHAPIALIREVVADRAFDDVPGWKALSRQERDSLLEDSFSDF